MGTFRLFVPKQAVGANLVYFDLFNASGSGYDVELLTLIPVVSGAVAVTGTLGVDLHLTKTTAVGTGGTAATANGTSLTAMTITAMAGLTTVPALITGRLTPSGGATAGASVSWCCVFTEETNTAAYFGHTNDLVRRNMADVAPLVISPNSGVRVVQGSVASVGNIGFDGIFRLKPK